MYNCFFLTVFDEQRFVSISEIFVEHNVDDKVTRAVAAQHNVDYLICHLGYNSGCLLAH